MTLAGLVQLVTRDLKAARTRASISAAGIALGIWVLTLIVALGTGVRHIIMNEWVHELPIDTLEVVPKSLDLGLFKVNAGGLLGAAPLDAAMRDKLQALPDVSAVYPALDVPLPLGAQGGARIFGRRLYTDLFMTGLPEELVRPEVGDGFHDTPDIVPVVISDGLIDMFNGTVAPSLGAPQLSGETLVGFEFELVIGRSMMLGNRGAKTTGIERARIVGVSPHALRLGISVPMATAQRLLARYADDPQEHYKSILVRAKSPEALPSIAQGIEALGYGIDETAQKTRQVLTYGTCIAAGVGALVLMLAGFNIAHSFLAALQARRKELAVLRAVGATQFDLASMVLMEAAILGMAGGTAGTVAAWLTAQGFDRTLHAWLPNLPFKPAAFFAFEPWLFGLSLGAAAVAALLGAAWPAWRSARAHVARALSE